ncbi:MAG: deoxyribodipyrimidine photo-lyase, partial [Acetobacter orientalis]
MNTQVLTPRPVIMLFRDDFRLADNPALNAAHASGQPVVCAFVHDPDTQRPGAIGWWLDQARSALAATLREQGGTLLEVEGTTPEAVPQLAKIFNAETVFWNRRYDPTGKAQDTQTKATLEAQGVCVHSLPGRLLHEPWTVQTGSGQPYKVFTAWWRAVRDMPPPGRCVSAPRTLT